MPQSQDPFARGMSGPRPALPTRADEAYFDFVSDARHFLMHKPFGRLLKAGQDHLTRAERETGRKPNSIEALRDVLTEMPEMSVFLRAKRTLQEIKSFRFLESFEPYREAYAEALDKADKSGPGSVSWDPDFIYPDYAKVDIHIMPGGYTGSDIAGLLYDQGTRVFFDGAADQDDLHISLAEKTSVPADGTVTRVLELGCSVGQLSCALKRRFPKAEVWGIDIGAPMVRYAHWRAIQHGADVHFAQMASESLTFPDEHFDLVTAHILFHEIPVEVIRETLRETFRVLRKDGTFVLWDFATATDRDPSYTGFMGQMDAIDNGEPYALGFARCGVEDMIERTGFTLRARDPETLRKNGRVADKPA